MVKLRNNKLPSSQQFLQKKDEGKTCARSCIAPLRENHNTGGRTLSNVDIGYGSNALIYDGKSNTDPPVFMKQINHCSFPNSPLVPLRLTYPDAKTNSHLVLHEISNSTKQNGGASPATQVAAAFHRWRYSHLKVEQRLQMELLKAIERAETAEATVEKRNIEINRLREELRKVEEEKNKTSTKLQEKIVLLRNENDCEVQNVMDQLTGKIQEPPSYLLKRSNLGSRLGKQKRKHVKQIKEKVNTLDEKDTSKFNFSLEEVGMALQCRSNEKPKAHKQVSIELEQHLKRLTSYVQNLETCIQRGGHRVGYEKRSNSQQQSNMQKANFAAPVEPVTVCFETSNSMHIANTNEISQNHTISSTGVKKSSYYLHSDFELDMPRDITQKMVTSKQQPYLHQNQKIISWSESQSQERITAVATVDSPGKFTNLLSRCISWKWRWAAAASQLKALSKELQTMTITNGNKTLGALTTAQASAANRDKFITSMQKLGFIHAQNLHSTHNLNKGRNVPAKSKQKEAKFSVSGHKVISIMLSMWRASIKNAKLEKEAVCKGEKLSRLLSGLPWLIQRFEERRHLERMFYHWVLHMLRSKIQIYHASIHQSGSWSCWQKRPPSSLWVAQLGLPDVRSMDGNGYQGRYMRYTHTKPNERQLLPAETRKPSNKSPEINGPTINHQECVENMRNAEDGMDGFPLELSCSAQKDNRLYLCPSKCLTTESPCASHKIAADQDNNAVSSIDDFTWNKNYNVTSFTEKAMQTLQVSLYNELQKLQDLIVREARLHQEKVKEKEGGTNQEEIGSNASPFSTSLWRICNGLAHCLIEARNQILALAGNSESKTCQKLATMSKVCKKSKDLSNKGSEKTYQRTRFRFLKTESTCKEEKSSYKNLECESKQVAGDGEILEFVGAGKVATQKVSELGTRYISLMESRTHVDLTK